MLKKINLFAIALATAISGGSVFASMDVASAAVFKRQEPQNNDVCYQARRVPATVEYDTRGTLLRGSERRWEGNMQRNGALVRNRFHDEVYIQSRRVLENQHMTLVQVPCR